MPFSTSSNSFPLLTVSNCWNLPVAVIVEFQDGAADGATRGDAVGSGMGALVGVPDVGRLDGSDDIDGCDVGTDEIVGVVDGVDNGDDVGLVDVVGVELGFHDVVGEILGVQDVEGYGLGSIVVGLSVGDVVGETIGDNVGGIIGDTVGGIVGDTVGGIVGDTVGDIIGAIVGDVDVTLLLLLGCEEGVVLFWMLGCVVVVLF
mmetsp:Transcript_25172/g.39033  ORF Transcript_25172/g.39033 Transcript_25172/m.39033 type:complete len:203 (-) Transcript_25172:103-711(-)